MNKIITAFDGLRFSENTLEYAISLAAKGRAEVVGIFLRERTGLGYAVYESLVEQSVPGKSITREIARSDLQATSEAIALFESRCTAAGIPFKVHRDLKDPVRELIHESQFADLLIIDMWETFSYLELNLPGWFLRNILHQAMCPVLVVPKKFRPIKKLTLLYDGSPSSVQAMKMMIYVLPELRKAETTLLYAEEKKTAPELPDGTVAGEWVSDHFPRITYQLIEGGEKEIISRLTKLDPESLVVAGAYHRSKLSMWFSGSMADLLMREINLPVFIAHT